MRAFLAAGIAGAVISASCPGQAFADMLTTATGYRLEYAVRGQDAPGPVALIIMHGKNAPPESVMNRLTQWADRVARQGFRVYVPVMPWGSRWDGTHEDATSAVDALVELAAKDGKKVVVGGHSMGAMFTIVYRASSLPPAVIGKFISAPGHLLDMIPANAAFWNGIDTSISRAKSLESEGKGKARASFGGRNVAGAFNTSESYEMTPEVYLSWHDPERLPRASRALAATTVPVLFAVGELDPLAGDSASQRTFDMIPRHPGSAYLVLEDKDHSNSLPAVIEKLVPWIKSLGAP